ncbi:MULTISPECIES: squalene/phytoene synthase family protein [unclassified Corynebacterium]|uniref:phytoene/squalene synthase family protein n=1 Tax=Corynebacterium TaxID=1716 RepID=UPI00254BF2D0|nr:MULTISPECIES: squalene/phytoene synthase family protein [unclassified Corynebacterium]MDK8702477.1 squalene/phytoene synthase family protein [Corynebacterium sp. MSK107]MDK8704534.1 squalene/phytoene synthase family protein [Corynebacterium sp. MSK090]
MLTRYDQAASRAAAQVMGQYSTSFTLATRLLRGRVREDIRHLYAVVRIADELVDGTAHQASIDAAAALDAYEAAILAAPEKRLHTDPVVHSYAITARRCGFQRQHLVAFFDSMRADLSQREYSAAELAEYIYGSAEVIGLLCVQVFLAEETVSAADRATMNRGARHLGAAFQKINFLRDLGEDSSVLGRAYFPQAAGGELSEAAKSTLIADIRHDLAAAEESINLLPLSARFGVRAAADIFAELTNRLAATPAAELKTTRISVPNRTKAWLAARAVRAVR